MHSITLELKHVNNHYDIRRGVCATSLSAKEKGIFRKQPSYKTKFGLKTIQIYE